MRRPSTTPAPPGVALFPFLGPAHPFAAGVAAFAAEIRRHPEHDRLAAAVDAGATVHAEIKALPTPDGRSFSLDRFYWSVQERDAAGFRATTLSYAAKDGRTVWLDFPEDPYLTTMAAAPGPPPDVLRYVPLRRCTFRTTDDRGEPAIGKYKRRSRYREAWSLLAAVAGALADGRAEFAVSRPVALDDERAMYLQSVLAGEDLADLLGEASDDEAAGLLRRAGALHRALHEAQVPGAPVQDPAVHLDGLLSDAAWIAFALPAAAAEVRDVTAVLQARAPSTLGGAATFCHGDYVPSQALVAPRQWAITDFDLCHVGDPYRDIGIFLAALTYDVPALQRAAEEGDDARVDAAAAAYLDGYAQRAGAALDRERLLWHRARAEVYYLGLMLKKDRHHPARFARGLGIARECAGALAAR